MVTSRDAVPALRVALVSSSYWPYLGGVEEHTRRAAIGLLERGHAVEVWTARRDDDTPAAEIVDGIRLRRLPTPLPTSSWSGAAHFAQRGLPAAAQWRRAIGGFAPDLLHVHCFGPNGVYASAASALTRIPLVISLHGETFMDDHGAFAESRVLRASLRAGLSRAAAVTGCSQITLDDARARFGLAADRGTVVFNGVDLDEQHGETPWQRPFDHTVLALGRMTRNKGFDLLVTAFAQVAQRNPGWGLVILGDGPERPRLQQAVTHLGLADRVLLPGRAERATVGSAMAAADVFVLPSRIEPFGIVALEAWRAGCAVLATDRGGTREFVDNGRTGLLADPHHTTEFADALDLLVNDVGLRERLAAAGRAQVRAFGVERVTDRYEEIYRQVLAAGTSRAGGAAIAPLGRSRRTRPGPATCAHRRAE